jgi:hypothetical protein
MIDSEQKFYRQAYWLSLFTIFYNIIEGIVSVVLGYTDETLSLFGFGADSFIEVMSGIGIAIMILRIKHNPNSPESILKAVLMKNGKVKLCGTCADARGIKEMKLVEVAELSTMKELTQWTIESDKVIPF